MKILVIRLSSLGDIILTQSICAWLRSSYPEAEIDFLCKSQFVELVSLMGCGLKPIVYEKSLHSHLVLRAKAYDLVLDLHNKLSTFLIRLAAAGKVSSTYDKQRSIRKRIVAGEPSLAIRSTVELYRSALTKIGLAASLLPPVLKVPDLPMPVELPQGKKLIMLFPGAAHFTKMYPAASYKELLKSSPEDYYYLIAGSRSEHLLCEELHQASYDYSQNLAGKLDFAQILRLMDACDWVISSDSGPMHLAAGIGKAQIAIFGATHPRLGFAPNNPHAQILVEGLSCQPCSLHGGKSCPQGHFKCMLNIKPERILSILKGSA